MLSKIPIDLLRIKPEDIDKEILRTAIIAEHDAINLYEEMTALAKNKHIKTVLLDVAKEEKEHIGEFQTLLLTFDTEQSEALEEGRKEVEELTS
jgi:rubrerythrin